MNFSNFSAPNNIVDDTFQKREARPGDVVMLNDLAADAIGKNPVVPDWADAANYAISQPLAGSLVRLGTLNAGGADEAWQIVRAARCSEDCSYIGMDLHSTNVVVSIVRNVRDGHGRIVRRKLLNRRVDTRDGGVVLAQVLEPFCDEGRPHIAVVESTYNIYFIADLFELKGWTLLIADPCAVSQARLKATNDYTDAEYLAEKLCSDSLHVSLLLPHEDRATRDLVRLRMNVVQERARAKIIFINMMSNQLGFTVDGSLDKLARIAFEKGTDCQELVDIYPDSKVREKAAFFLRHIHYLNSEVEHLNEIIHPDIRKLDDAKLLKAIPGCGDVIASTIVSEIWDINRFPSAKDFVSYCRLAPTSRLSNGKSKGMGNAKNGNAYLSWAVTELANLIVRFNKTAAKMYARLFKKYGKLRVKAIRSLAARLARAIYHVLKTKEPFDEEKCFGFRVVEAESC